MARDRFDEFIATLIAAGVIVLIRIGLFRVHRAVSTLKTSREVTSGDLREITSQEAASIAIDGEGIL